jgi:serine/threonine protein kinase/tetratricopeptide (TPR) repeat protein
MTPERWQQIDALFADALECPEADRSAFLDAACGDDLVLRREVEALLAVHQQGEGFMESTPTKLMSELFKGTQGPTKVGELFLHYRILAFLGSGGMGEVYLAEDTTLRRQVAIKLLPASLTQDSGARARFLREAQLAATLDHPNICTIHEISEASGYQFIAMQYAEGRVLKEVIADKPLTIKNILSISLQVADALAAAHDRAIIHRDIKSTNIIIGSRGQAKVLDFGLAKLLETDLTPNAERPANELTQTGVMLGTPAYMSPEQAKGKRADYRSDIFSFGVVLYEMATGRIPFSEESHAETMNAVINQPHTSVIEMNKEVPLGLAAVIDRALSKRPEDRYQSMHEIITDLKQLAIGLGFSSLSAIDGVIVRYDEPQKQATSRRIPSWLGRGAALKLALTIVIVLSLIVIGTYLTVGRSTIQGPLDSIAVLPLSNVGADTETEYLADGITEGLISDLSQLSNLKVMSRTAVFRYKGKEVDPKTAARELQVQVVVIGQIVARGDNLAISLEMIDAKDNSRIWGEQYDRKLSEVLATQTEISRKISGKLRLRLSSVEQKQLAKQHTNNADAYQLYLKGRYLWNRMTEEGARKSIPYFDQALEKDPSYVLAYCGLADAYNLLGIGFARPGEVFPKAREAALKALELDDTTAEAHISMGTYKMFYEWDWAEAERQADRAKQLNPSYASAIEVNTNYGDGPHFYCWYLDLIGKSDESIREIKRGLEIAPLSALLNSELGWSYYIARQYDQAIEQCRIAIELDSASDFAYYPLATAYEQKGMYLEALAELKKARALPAHSLTIISEIGYSYAELGQKAEAQKIIHELTQRATRDYVDPTLFAYIYIGLNDNDRAFFWLEKAYQDRAPGLTWLKVDPKFDGLRGDPRFKTLLRHMGLVQERS